jgi:hypothetical protein
MTTWAAGSELGSAIPGSGSVESYKRRGIDFSFSRSAIIQPDHG